MTVGRVYIVAVTPPQIILFFCVRVLQGVNEGQCRDAVGQSSSAAVERGVRGVISRRLVLAAVHPLNTAMLGLLTALVCVVYTASLLVRQLTPVSSPSAEARFWTSQATKAGVTTTALLHVCSHLLVMFERHLAGSRPTLHARLVTRSTAVLGVSALWIYSVLLASIPVLRCVIVSPRCALHVELEMSVTHFGHGYVVYLAAQFIFAAVASALLTVSVVNRRRRAHPGGSTGSSDLTRRLQTASAHDDGRTRRCVVALVVGAVLWTPCVAFQLVDQLGCAAVAPPSDRSEVIIGVVSRQVSPLVGLCTGPLLPLIYLCSGRPSLFRRRVATSFNSANTLAI